MTAKEIETRLKPSYPELAYSTIFSWLKRKVERGEYSKRGDKYRYIDPSSRSATD